MFSILSLPLEFNTRARSHIKQDFPRENLTAAGVIENIWKQSFDRSQRKVLNSLKSIILTYLFLYTNCNWNQAEEMEEMNERDFGLDFFQSLGFSKAALLPVSEGPGLSA